jgi:ribosomal protein L24, bacterial/organelle
MRKIKKGDEVVVLTGKCRGQRGKVLRVLSTDDCSRAKVIVDGINLVKKCVKANPNANKPGGIMDREAPLELSNVGIYNPVTGKGDRVFFKTLENGTKVRCFKSSGELVDVLNR